MLIRSTLSWTGPALLALAMSAATLARAEAAPLAAYGYGQSDEAAGPVFDLRDRLPAMPAPAPAPAPVAVETPAAPLAPALRAGEGESAQCNAVSDAGLAATHPVLRQGTLAFVTDLKTRKEVIVRITGRGPTRLSTDASAALGCQDQTQITLRDLAPAQAGVAAPRYVETAFTPAKPARTGAFMVQIGAFSDRANAERAKDQADSAGDASIEQVSANGRTLYRVRLGPWDDRGDAERAQAKARRLGFRDATVTGR